MKLYKVLNDDGMPCHGGTGTYPLPHDGQPGEWMQEVTGVIPCKLGYHVATAEQLIEWLGPAIYECDAPSTLEPATLANDPTLRAMAESEDEGIAAGSDDRLRATIVAAAAAECASAILSAPAWQVKESARIALALRCLALVEDPNQVRVILDSIKAVGERGVDAIVEFGGAMAYRAEILRLAKGE
jgi:hypothetical protein